jgi:hypothetical protein
LKKLFLLSFEKQKEERESESEKFFPGTDALPLSLSPPSFLRNPLKNVY